MKEDDLPFLDLDGSDVEEALYERLREALPDGLSEGEWAFCDIKPFKGSEAAVCYFVWRRCENEDDLLPDRYEVAPATFSPKDCYCPACGKEQRPLSVPDAFLEIGGHMGDDQFEMEFDLNGWRCRSCHHEWWD